MHLSLIKIIICLDLPRDSFCVLNNTPTTKSKGNKKNSTQEKHFIVFLLKKIIEFRLMMRSICVVYC